MKKRILQVVVSTEPAEFAFVYCIYFFLKSSFGQTNCMYLICCGQNAVFIILSEIASHRNQPKNRPPTVNYFEVFLVTKKIILYFSTYFIYR